MKIKYLLAASAATLASVGFASSAAAQSTGSTDFDEGTIVVTGTLDLSVGGIENPNTPRAKQELGEEIIRRQRPGQTVNDIVNLVPGVSFQNNDPWGSSGGGFTIRGFGADRVSQTLDGLPLNDSGNYALYTNQQVDSEVLERVSVNLGTTDVDSPTASASGGTINIRTRRPGDEIGVLATATFGDVLSSGAENTEFYRIFGMVDFGDLTGNGLTAFGALSYTNYGTPYNPYGEIDKLQFNGRVYQELGSNGDFISISGHYNRNRNNFAGSERLSTLLDFHDDPNFSGEDRFTVYEGAGEFPCTVAQNVLIGGGAGENGVSERYNDRGDCGSAFYRRFNPSDTGNIRINSLFNLTDNLTLTLDPSYQYVKANGGGPDDLREAFFTPFGTTSELTGAFRGGYYFGRDLNGDGDMLDRVAGNDPSQTRTDRYGIVANLIYDINSDHRVRVAYTLDHARHRQTGQITSMLPNGEISNVYAVDNALLDNRGEEVNKRDRLSFAILNQFSAEYAGNFGDLTAVVGLRMPFFTRELNQNCYTTSVNGFVDCPAPGQDLTEYEAANPDHVAPTSREYNYDRFLPSIGFTYALTDDLSAFGNYSRGISVPGTDPLYDSLYIADEDRAQPVPETTDSFDLGLRFQNGSVQAQLSGWYTRYDDRLASAFDPDARDGEGAVVFRNLGRVDKYGLDGSFSIAPTDNTLLYIFGSISESDIQDDVQVGVDSATDTPIFAATAGNAESGTPNFTIGGRGQVTFGPFDLGAQIKHTGQRWINDLNEERAPSYTLVDLDLRWNIAELSNGTNAALQINVTNLFDEYYIGFFGGSLDGFGFAQIGAPRAASATLIVGF
ncbi:TonB-dependent receptor [Aurantiacibacter sp. D1-12]|uniref:TonB-dependent receptor n=1 Tax=Aurantiacibacter sp. D1-12 TaxID=2993658 RepID=UPI00237CE5CD|nr:TonB-dependent receptor [Aurantiacibacter sp. D1-12]MDE1466197.1 TonB-dependent receptor [Aurantiacibacter sp. D1-12]